ncbi:MAG: hypothetical protein ACKO2C_03940 [Actinomycetes bacterium]
MASIGGLTVATTGVASAAVGPYYTTASPYLNARSGPGTGYSIVGTLNYWSPIYVQCQVQGGTDVGGNRTWDKLSNGWWISDYWTTTPSFNSYIPGVPDCNTPPPASSPSIAEEAARRAEARIGQVYTTENPNANYWSGWCETFAELAYQWKFRYASAMADYNSLKSRGLIKGGVPPRGALVFYTNGTYGHVGIGVGNGYIVSTVGYTNNRYPVARNYYTYFPSYAGWALPYGA